MMVWEYFTHFHKSALCYTDVHVYRATSLKQAFLLEIARVIQLWATMSYP